MSKLLELSRFLGAQQGLQMFGNSRVQPNYEFAPVIIPF